MKEVFEGKVKEGGKEKEGEKGEKEMDLRAMHRFFGEIYQW